MLTLDEAIAHCKEKAKQLRVDAYACGNAKHLKREKAECEECAAEHQQLAEWLTELKAFREWKTVYADRSIIVMKKENDE